MKIGSKGVRVLLSQRPPTTITPAVVSTQRVSGRARLPLNLYPDEIIGAVSGT